jgi:CoA:oxalate CoA-transferase
VSMLGALTSLIAGEGFDTLEGLGIPTRTGATVARLAPFGVYATRTGHVAICAPTDAFASGLFRAMGMPTLAKDPRFATRDARVANNLELDASIEAWTRVRTTDAIVEELLSHGVPASAVREPGEAVRDPRVVSREECVPLSHPVYGTTAEVYGMGIPIKFSAARAGFDRPAPTLGEHNQLIYGDLLGYSPERLHELAKLGVI